MSEPKILYLCSSCPHGDSCGGGLRAQLTLEGLRLAGRVTIVPVSLMCWSEQALAITRDQCHVTRQVLQLRQARRVSTTVLRNVSAAIVNTDNRIVGLDDRVMIDAMRRDADLIWVEEIGVANALRVWRWERSVLDADDLQSNYLWAKSRYGSVAQRARETWRSHMWRRREARFFERFDRVVVCSEDDREYLGSCERLRVIPNTFDDSGLRIARTLAPDARFGFVGTIDYEPNSDGVRWFAREVMPIISRELPGAEFRVVGRSGAELIQGEALPLTALGYLNDPTDEMATWHAMVVPLRFGAGTRIKIAEAFARRIPVVSTRIGAYGYDVAHGRELMLADSPIDFARACISVAADTALAARLAASGAECLSRHYSTDSIKERVRRLASEVLDEESAQVAEPVTTARGVRGMRH